MKLTARKFNGDDLVCLPNTGEGLIIVSTWI